MIVQYPDLIMCDFDGNMGSQKRRESKTMTNDYFTTMARLRAKTSKNGAVVRYGFRVFRVDGNEYDGYTVEVYEFPDEPQEIGYPEDECCLQSIGSSGKRYRDAGSALHQAFRLS